MAGPSGAERAGGYCGGAGGLGLGRIAGLGRGRRGRSAIRAHAMIVPRTPLTATIVPHPIVVMMLHPHRLQLLPLLGCEHLAQVEEHARVGLFQIGAGLSDGIDLGEDFGFVRLVGFDHGPEHDFLLFEVGIQIDELQAMLQEMFSFWCFCWSVRPIC